MNNPAIYTEGDNQQENITTKLDRGDGVNLISKEAAER